MESYKEINKQINDYLQALTHDKAVFANVERRRVRIAKELLKPKNETLIDIEYRKLQEEADAFKTSLNRTYKSYSVNEQLMDVIKHISDNLNKEVKELGINGSQMQIDKLNLQAKQQVEQLRNDIALFVKNIKDFDAIKELPIGSANSIIPDFNPGFINYIEDRVNKDILIVPTPDKSKFNLVVLDKNKKINKQTGVIPLSDFTNEITNGNLTSYYKQVPDTQTLDMFYSDMDKLVESLIQTDAELKQTTGKGLFKKEKKSSKAPRRNQPAEPITKDEARKFFTNHPQGKQMLYSFLEDDDLLGFYKNLQYSDYFDKDKPFTTTNYLNAIKNYLVSKFNFPKQEVPQQQEQNPQEAIPPQI